jgi:uncharacterized protein (DUF362 family)
MASDREADSPPPRPPGPRRRRGNALSRRDLLRGLAGALAGWGLIAGGSRSDSGPGSSAEAAQTSARTPPLRREGVVVIVRSPNVIARRRRVNGAVVERMVEAGVKRLAGASEAAQAWRRFFDPGDVIGLKVNCLGAPATRTHVEVALAAAKGLQRAGVPERNLIVYDRLTDELRRAGYPISTGPGMRCFGTDQRGYDREPTTAGEACSCFSRIVSEDCTALLNLPLLKDHDVAGVTISLKNHFGSINNPNKLHPDNCCPYVADVNLAPAIRRKQRLIICDALEVIYDGGPTYRPATTQAYGALLMGTDPVALDRVGWEIIEGLREEAGLKPLEAVGREPRYIAVAADSRHRLGVADPARIRKLEVQVS